MNRWRGRAEDGFTLVELVVVIAIAGIVMGALSSAVIVGLRTTDETTQRLADSHDLQLLSIYLPADVQSAVEGRIDRGETAVACTDGPADGSNVVHLQWDEPGGPKHFTAAYRLEGAAGEKVLARYSCVDGGTARRVVVVHGLHDTIAPSATESGRAITLEVTLASGVTSRVTAVRRTPGAVPPELDVTFPSNGGEHNAAGWNAGCPTAGACGTASDSSGIQSVEVAVLRVATNLYWDGTAFASATASYTAATGTTSWSYPFASTNFPVDGSYAVVVRATNAIGTQTSTTKTFLVDRSLPVTTDNTASIGSAWKNADQTVTLSPTDSGGSGVDATYFTTNGSTPTAGSSKGTSVALTSEGSFTVKYFSVDGAGNQEAAKTAATTVRIDKTPPTASTLSVPNGRYVRNGASLSGTGTDALSGVASLEFLYCAGTACSPTVSLGSASGSPGSVVWNGQPADGAYRMLVRARDAAGNSLDSAVQAVTVDNTAPAVNPTLVQLVNNGGRNGAGKAEQGDAVVVGFSEALKASSLCSTWISDTSTQTMNGDNEVVVTITDSGANDTLTVSVTGPCANALRFGSLALGADYVSSTTTFSGSGNPTATRSALEWDPATKAMTVTLGKASANAGLRSDVPAAVVAYTPAAGVTDIAGNAVATTPVASAEARRF